MTSHPNTELRSGNNALDYLNDHYQPMDAKLCSVIKLLPKMGDDLYGDAKRAAKDLLRNKSSNPLVRLTKDLAALVSGSLSRKWNALTLCIFDLQLTVFFSEMSAFVGDHDIASALVDALLYQATGCEKSSPTTNDLLACGTQNARGIHKFQLAQKAFPHNKDHVGWTFASEFAAIECGNPNHFASVISVLPFSLIARVHARWHIKYLLYGTLPTKQDQQALDAMLKKGKEDFEEMINSLRKVT
jgi:hypothetical protein